MKGTFENVKFPIT